jgi:hypothetical protein
LSWRADIGSGPGADNVRARLIRRARHSSQCRQGFGRDFHKASAAILQLLQMLNRRFEQLVIGGRHHGILLTTLFSAQKIFDFHH